MGNLLLPSFGSEGEKKGDSQPRLYRIYQRVFRGTLTVWTRRNHTELLSENGTEKEEGQSEGTGVEDERF